VSLPFRFPTKILYAFLISPMRVTCPAHLILLEVIILIIVLELCFINIHSCKKVAWNARVVSKFACLCDENRWRWLLCTYRHISFIKKGCSVLVWKFDARLPKKGRRMFVPWVAFRLLERCLPSQHVWTSSHRPKQGCISTFIWIWVRFETWICNLRIAGRIRFPSVIVRLSLYYEA
jgi:hypothetical protein